MNKTVIRIAVLLVGITLVTSTAIAAVSVTVSEDFGGEDEDRDLAVEMSYELSPEDEDITDIQITIEQTDDSFLDHDSYARELSPGDADVEIDSVDEGVFEINQLDTDQELTLSFNAYPRDIGEELTMAIVTVEYVQDGQSLEDTTEIETDLSDVTFEGEREDEESGPSLLILLFGLLIGAPAGGIAVYWAIENL